MARFKTLSERFERARGEFVSVLNSNKELTGEDVGILKAGIEGVDYIKSHATCLMEDEGVPYALEYVEAAEWVLKRRNRKAALAAGTQSASTHSAASRTAAFRSAAKQSSASTQSSASRGGHGGHSWSEKPQDNHGGHTNHGGH